MIQNSTLSVAFGLHYWKSNGSEIPAVSLIPSIETPNVTMTWVLMACYHPNFKRSMSEETWNFFNERQRRLRSEVMGIMHTIDPCERSLNVSRVWDEIHFQCGLEPALHSNDGIQLPVKMKTPVDGTCKDPLNKWIASKILKR